EVFFIYVYVIDLHPLLHFFAPRRSSDLDQPGNIIRRLGAAQRLHLFRHGLDLNRTRLTSIP
ncbi:hypothetical protein PU683_22000, partial [Kosakonia cowanii]|uniref:hypothetical protein n=1 Tax=Kosakonia cowanii TaxID=208223 RepID=UPI0023F7E7E7